MSTRCDIVCLPAGTREYFICGILLVMDDSEQDEAVCMVFISAVFMNIGINYSPDYPQMIILTFYDRTNNKLSGLVHSSL
jgi:hypothetical protein